MQTWTITNQATTITVVHVDNLVTTVYTLSKSVMRLDFPFLITATHSPAMVYINYNNKQYYLPVGIKDLLAPVADDGKELWDKLVEWVFDATGGFGETVRIRITAADFNVNDYQNNLLIGLTAGTDFTVTTDDGSGTLQRPADDYAFVSATGTITIPAGNYLIEI